MPSLILNTCGTSLLTGGKITDELRSQLRQHTNSPTWEDMPQDVAQRLKKHAAERKQQLLDGDTAAVRRMSAELNGLLSWQKDRPNNPQDIYTLLATDTALGKDTADSIKQWLEKNGYAANIISAEGLRTSSLIEFRESLSGLVKDLIGIFEGYRDSGYSIHFNLTGGFKGLNGFLQALSTIYADQTFYLFEGSQELLLLPKLPFTLDAEKLIGDHLHFFRRISHGLPTTEEERKEIPDTLLFPIDQSFMLSEWGELLWLGSYKNIYQQRLWPSISERIIYQSGFEASTKGMPAHLLEITNDRIASLAEYAENDCKEALASLDPKPLQKKIYKDRNLWECDLDPHHRIFMVKDGYKFLLEKVDKALH